MIPVTQTRTGAVGNCMGAALASILDISIEDVPEFGTDDRCFFRDIQRFLTRFGLCYLQISPNDDMVRESFAAGDVYHVMEGISPRGGPHAVVGLNGEIAWDPHPNDGTQHGLVRLDCYGFLCNRMTEHTDRVQDSLAPISNNRQSRISAILDARRQRIADEFKESEHPRGGSENPGQFTSGGGGSTAKSDKPGSHSKPEQSNSGNLAAAPADRAQWPEHIKKLKLPPAWTDVRINSDADAALQAVGKDAKGRAQYVYSEKFRNSQAAAKFARIKELDAKFDAIRRQNAERLRSGDPRVGENAECAALVMAMGIRPGSETDTKAKVQAYGATTLRGSHVVTEGGQVYLRFTGKKGVALNLPVTDPQLAKVLATKAQAAGSGGKLFPQVSDKSLLDYIHTLNGGGFKTKDFRTCLASREAMRAMRSIPVPKNEKEYKRRVLDIAKHVSSKLGNTPTVALQSYIPPEIFTPWRSALAA